MLHSIVSGRVILHLHIAAKERTGLFTDGFDIYVGTKVSGDRSTYMESDVIVLGRLDDLDTR